jgi:hypothetical protein
MVDVTIGRGAGPVILPRKQAVLADIGLTAAWLCCWMSVACLKRRMGNVQEAGCFSCNCNDVVAM